MTPSGQTLCLCMIVKDEAPVIRRCLASVRPLVDHWIVVDTGSTDGTQRIVRDAMEGLPGEVVDRPWKDFAHNRSEALALARPHGSYSLIIDADDELVLPPGYRLPDLRADSYLFDIRDGSTTYRRPQLVANRLPWCYRGVLHEFLHCAEAGTVDRLPVLMRRNHDGARRRDASTYGKDAEILERALRTESEPFLVARYTFYLAQSYRDCGQRAKALQAYLKRATRGFWNEEVFFSLYQAGRLMEALKRHPDEILATYARATAASPSRAEAAHAASRLCRALSRHQQGCEVARPALDLSAPDGGLFVEPWIYDYGLLDEFAVNAFWAGRHREALDAGLKALRRGKVPAGEQPRLLANMQFALDRLPAADPPAPPSVGVAPARLASPTPRVLVAILAKQKEPVLRLYLACLEALDYPKSSIVLYVRTNNNTDRTGNILREWLDRVAPLYAGVEFDDADVPVAVEAYGVHEWNATRFRVLAEIRDASLRKTIAHGCAFYFVADVDNFLAASTLRELVALDMPIVAPLLRHVDPKSPYANFHADIDANGYFVESSRYRQILTRATVGIIEVPVVHCTYLIRADVLPRLRYGDGSPRHEYVVFSESARRQGIPQYLDNRRPYGLLTLDDDAPAVIGAQVDEIARKILGERRDAPRRRGAD